MLVAKLLPFVQSLATRKWSDDEVKEDVEFLVEELRTSFEGLTYVYLSWLLLFPSRSRTWEGTGLIRA